MKKSLYLLAALSLLGTNVFAKEVVAEPVVSPVVKETGIVEEVVNEETDIMTEVVVPANKWVVSGNIYLESEDFDNDSRANRDMTEFGDANDAVFWGTGVSATKGKLTLGLNVERRYFNDFSLDKGFDSSATRVDYKVRYQLFEKQAFSAKYRNEPSKNRYEIGTDFNHFNGLLAGWLVVGEDRIKGNDGWYWEGDFGPSFKLTDKLSFNPTVYTTGEFYDSYEMVETQIRLMFPYQVNEKLTVMPRVRITLDKTWDTKDAATDSYVRDWENSVGDRIRYELMANYVFNDQLSTFVGVAYEDADRDMKNANVLGGKDGKEGLDMIWSYVGFTYNFN
ncbi:hypothetical protein [Cetobacterium sp. ZWU0022]|uniref:hypothetical protein n=1 Tax=Cetobacterium sp. ZWU0022 TaxID=1340502 RepID=UPI000647B1D2|nr:hypothetical protein [Cetobacterium sp. ZWU0022]